MIVTTMQQLWRDCETTPTTQVGNGASKGGPRESVDMGRSKSLRGPVQVNFEPLATGGQRLTVAAPRSKQAC